MRITLAGVILAISSIAILIYSFHARSLLLLALSMMILMIFLKSYRDLSRLSRLIRSIEIRREVDRRYVEEGDEILVSVEVINRSRENVGRLEIEDLVPEPAKAIEEPLIGVSLPPGYIARLRYRVKLPSPGRYEFERIFIRLKDPLGLFTHEGSVDLVSMVVALPKPLGSMETVSIASRNPGIWIKGLSLGGLYDLYSVRDYQYGDDARKILWKILAKRGELLVREDLGEVRSRSYVIIDIPRELWYIGKPPNTLAEGVARLSRGVIEGLVKSYSVVDAIICEETASRIVSGISRSYREKIYSLYLNLKPYRGCESSWILYNSLKYLDLVRRDMAILVTTPIGLAQADPELMIPEVSRLGRNVYIAIYMPEDYSKEYMEILGVALPIIEDSGWGILVAK
ncbi:MAG: DUF58 domain-containing protein [Sulfolobales archaeon]